VAKEGEGWMGDLMKERLQQDEILILASFGIVEVLDGGRGRKEGKVNINKVTTTTTVMPAMTMAIMAAMGKEGRNEGRKDE
jgi:hypothetical protein